MGPPERAHIAGDRGRVPAHIVEQYHAPDACRHVVRACAQGGAVPQGESGRVVLDVKPAGSSVPLMMAWAAAVRRMLWLRE